MPLNKDIKRVLVIGSGPIVIGQAAEFDYTGTQACRALKQHGLEVILINSNPATIMTDNAMADKIYIEPLTLETVKRVIKKERPDSVLSTLGGQTGLTLSMQLAKEGFLDKYNVRLLGARVETIDKAEDRQMFKDTMESIGQPCIPSKVVNTVEDAVDFAGTIGYPLIIRPAFTLGGTGGGIVHNEEELRDITRNGLYLSPITQVLVEKCISGWKEIEFEVIRDSKGNCITVCSMENVDPVGVHTGDSIVIAPAVTLSTQEYAMLRSAALKIVDTLEVEGGCNCQFALDPESNRYAVIEVNPRVSRSSALASKATGYPLAFVAAKLGLGYGLFELKNSVTKTTSAFFEPALDYVVCKIPRWDLSKFHGVNHELGSSMKSVGEVMAIGRTFEEAIQKGLRMIGQGMHGLVDNHEIKIPNVIEALRHATDIRVFAVAKAMAMGYSVKQIHELTKIDCWFLEKLRHIMLVNERLKEFSWLAEYYSGSEYSEFLEAIEAPEFSTLLLEAKTYGFSDFQIARALGLEADMKMERAGLMVRKWRQELGIMPTVNQIDTLAAEYPAQTNYLYLSYL